MSENDELYDVAQKAISAGLSDKNTSRQQAIENLDALAGEIDTLIECLRNDQRREEEGE